MLPRSVRAKCLETRTHRALIGLQIDPWFSSPRQPCQSCSWKYIFQVITVQSTTTFTNVRHSEACFALVFMFFVSAPSIRPSRGTREAQYRAGHLDRLMSCQAVQKQRKEAARQKRWPKAGWCGADKTGPCQSATLRLTRASAPLLRVLYAFAGSVPSSR